MAVTTPDNMNTTPATDTRQRRPAVIGIVAVSLLGAIYYLLRGNYLFMLINDANTQGAVVPGNASMTAFLTLGIGIMLFLVAWLVLARKKVGLYFGLLVYGLAILSSLMTMGAATTSDQSNTMFLPLLIHGAVVYHLYKFLTHEPEKHDFN